MSPWPCFVMRTRTGPRSARPAPESGGFAGFSIFSPLGCSLFVHVEGEIQGGPVAGPSEHVELRRRVLVRPGDFEAENVGRRLREPEGLVVFAGRVHEDDE